MQVAKWENSLAVRLPAGLVDALGLREGDEIEFVVHHAGDSSGSCEARPEALLLPLRRFRGKLPGDFKFRRNDTDG